jgi:hypothetical protein
MQADFDYNQVDYTYSSAFSSERIIGEHSRNIAPKHTLAVDSLIAEITHFITESEFYIQKHAVCLSHITLTDLTSEWKKISDKLDEFSSGIAQAKHTHISNHDVYVQRELSIFSCKSRLLQLNWIVRNHLKLLVIA